MSNPSDEQLESYMEFLDKVKKHMSKATEMKKEWDANPEKYANIPMEIQGKDAPSTRLIGLVLDVGGGNTVTTYMLATYNLNEICDEIVKLAMAFYNVEKILVPYGITTKDDLGSVIFMLCQTTVVP
jgi:hypothetical protein